MARDDAPPFNRGEYEASEDLSHMLGREWQFEDLDFAQTSGARAARSGKMVSCRLVKNNTGAALLPKRLVTFSTTAGEYNTHIGHSSSAYSCLTNDRAFPVDEFLPSAGVPDQAYFWVVTRGPAMCLLPLAGAGFNGDVSVGNTLSALTAATAGATTAGRVANTTTVITVSGSDYVDVIKAAENYVGRALSAATTGNTGSSLLVDVGKW